MSIAQETVLAGERERTIASMVIARAWRDPAYRGHLRHEPKAVLAGEGLEIPAGIDIRVVEDTPTARYLSLPAEISDAEQAMSVLWQEIPVDEGRELRLVRNTERTRYLVVPMPPAEPEKLSAGELSRRAAQDGIVVTFTSAVVVAQSQTQIQVNVDVEIVVLTLTVTLIG